MKYRACDEFPNSSGIYIIGFNNSKKVYVGSTFAKGRFKKRGFSLRWPHHLYRLRNSTHEKKLQNAYHKYGEENIFFQILELCEEKEKIERENFWIKFYNSFKYGYNSQETAEPTLERLNKFNKKRKRVIKERQSKLESVILELYKQNLSNIEICKIANVSKNTVTKYLKKNNIKNTNGWINNAEKKAKKVYCFNTYTKEIKEYKSVLKCSKEIGVTNNSIYGVLSKKVKLKQVKGYSFSTKKLTVSEFEKFIEKGNRWHPKPKN